jgi:AraC-like DNA-binding protein
VSHAIVTVSARALLVFLDPEDEAGAALAARVRGSGVGAWIGAAAELAEMPRALELPALLAKVLAAAGTAPEPRELHRGVREVLRLLPDRVGDDSAVRIAELAKRAALSESRLMHLFRAQVGIPLRPYMRWLRLRHAANVVRTGGTLTEAAHAAGFADSAHLSTTFHKTFGISPSEITRNIDWIE